MAGPELPTPARWKSKYILARLAIYFNWPILAGESTVPGDESVNPYSLLLHQAGAVPLKFVIPPLTETAAISAVPGILTVPSVLAVVALRAFLRVVVPVNGSKYRPFPTVNRSPVTGVLYWPTVRLLGW